MKRQDKKARDGEGRKQTDWVLRETGWNTQLQLLPYLVYKWQYALSSASPLGGGVCVCSGSPFCFMTCLADWGYPPGARPLRSLQNWHQELLSECSLWQCSGDWPFLHVLSWQESLWLEYLALKHLSSVLLSTLCWNILFPGFQQCSPGGLVSSLKQ